MERHHQQMARDEREPSGRGREVPGAGQAKSTERGHDRDYCTGLKRARPVTMRS